MPQKFRCPSCSSNLLSHSPLKTAKCPYCFTSISTPDAPLLEVDENAAVTQYVVDNLRSIKIAAWVLAGTMIAAIVIGLLAVLTRLN